MVGIQTLSETKAKIFCTDFASEIDLKTISSKKDKEPELYSYLLPYIKQGKFEYPKHYIVGFTNGFPMERIKSSKDIGEGMIQVMFEKGIIQVTKDYLSTLKKTVESFKDIPNPASKEYVESVKKQLEIICKHL